MRVAGLTSIGSDLPREGSEIEGVVHYVGSHGTLIGILRVVLEYRRTHCPLVKVSLERLVTTMKMKREADLNQVN